MPAQPGSPYDDRANQNSGLITAMNNRQLDAMQERERGKSAEFAQTSPVLSSLSGHIENCWSANKSAKSPIEKVLLQCLRQRNGEYDPEVLTQIQEQGEEAPIFMMITDIKCRAFESWMKDIMIPANEVPFRADPTPVPDLPETMREIAKAKIVGALQEKMMMSGRTKEDLTREDVIGVGEQIKKELLDMMEEQAKDDAEQLTTEINDQLTEGGWYEALEAIIEDIATYPTAFMEGPIPRKKKVLEWQDGKPVPVDKIVREYERVSPFDIFPSAGAKTLQGGNLIIRKKFSPHQLRGMIGVEGFDEAAIRAVLDLYGIGGLKEWLSVDSAREILEDHHNTLGDQSPTIDCLKFWGSVQGKMLLDWGMTEEQIPDPEASYPIIAYKIGTYIISARLNPHPLGRRNVYYASFVKKNDSIWGRGVAQVLKDVNRICNSAARALIRNMGITSGPMAWVIEDRISPDQRATEMHPWKLWRFTSKDAAGKSDIPMGFFNPTSVTSELLAIYKHYYDQAGEVSGIPAYTYASEKVGGAGQTASGLSMLFNAAGKVMRGTAGHIDGGIIKPSVGEHWLYIMIYEPEKAKGDINIVARASDAMMQVEQMQAAASEALERTGNPIDMQIIGLEGRGEILREYIKRLKMPVDKIVPDREAIIQNTVEAKVAEFIQQLAMALGVDPQRLVAIAQQGGAPGQPQQKPQQQQPQPQGRIAA